MKTEKVYYQTQNPKIRFEMKYNNDSVDVIIQLLIPKWYNQNRWISYGGVFNIAFTDAIVEGESINFNNNPLNEDIKEILDGLLLRLERGPLYL